MSIAIEYNNKEMLMGWEFIICRLLKDKIQAQGLNLTYKEWLWNRRKGRRRIVKMNNLLRILDSISIALLTIINWIERFMVWKKQFKHWYS
jgi:hypothetical protein